MHRESLVRRAEQWQPGQAEEEVVRFVAELLREYLAATDEERRALRTAVRGNLALYDDRASRPDRERTDALPVYLSRLPRGNQDEVTAYLRAQLLSLSLVNGGEDWQSTAQNLVRLRQWAESRGVDPGPHFVEIAATAATDDRGTPELCMRELMLTEGRPEAIRRQASQAYGNWMATRKPAQS